MKKIALLIVLLIVSFNAVQAQNWEEWTKQKKTQVKYLQQQIVALQVYIGYLKKGYEVVDKGLTTIGNIKDGDFNLHRDFFGTFKAVNPKIRNSVKVADIIACQIQIIRAYQSDFKRIKASGQFNSTEIDYIYKVFGKLLDETAENVEELITLITANQYEMKDDERLQRIDGIYSNMKSKYAMVRQFGNEATILAVQRLKERSDIEAIRSLNGINKN
jgi:hypothetical protein